MSGQSSLFTHLTIYHFIISRIRGEQEKARKNTETNIIINLTTKQQQMKKKLYQKPTMKVIKLQPQAQLLAGSAGVNDYTWHDEEEE